jgi:hypothetical protein
MPVEPDKSPTPSWILKHVPFEIRVNDLSKGMLEATIFQLVDYGQVIERG